MLSIAHISSSSTSQASEYFLGLTGATDYYASQFEKPGVWLGQGATLLGLTGIVEYDQLPAVLAGVNPISGELLAALIADRRAATDCTFSAPKSVSVAWALADPDLRTQIEKAHQAAVANGVDYLEREAFATRHGAGGHEHRSALASGGLIVASFQHSSSREGDPQLHTHALVMNMTPDGRSIDFDSTHKMAAGALYRAELANQLQKNGFQIAACDIKEGDLAGFKIVNVPDGLTEKWSSRRNEMEEYLLKNGLENTPENAQKAALDTRKTKVEQPLEELFLKWKDEAKAFDFDSDKVAELAGNEKTQSVTMALPSNTTLDDQKVLEKITVKEATFTKQQALTGFAVDQPGRYSAAEVETRTTLALAGGEIVKLNEFTKQEAASLGEHLKHGQRYTTPEMLATEARIIEVGKKLAGYNPKFCIDQTIIKQAASAKNLSNEQKNALIHLCQGNRLSIVQGYAGSGKTFLLSAAKDAFEQSGFEVIGTAISSKAASGLAESTGIQSSNIAMLQINIAIGLVNLTEKTVLIVDEAGMVGTKQLAQLMQQVDSAGSKLILVGHTQQLQAIEAGAPMRSLAAEIGEVKLTEVRRQKTELQREIVNDFRTGNAVQALQKLDEIGGLSVTSTQMQALQVAATASLCDQRMGATSMLIAASREEVRQLNLIVRSELKNDGVIDQASEVTVKTTQGMRNFAAGDQIIFGQKKNFGAKGEKQKTVINGTRGTVISTLSNKGNTHLVVELDCKQVITVNTTDYQKIDHGYATTAHKSQGATVDHTHVVINDRSGKEWSYVAGSRHRESLTIYTSKDYLKTAGVDLKDKSQKYDFEKSDLSKSMEKSAAKDMASDYTRQTEPSAHDR